MTSVNLTHGSTATAPRQRAWQRGEGPGDARPSPALPHPFVLSIWFGLVTGLLELGLVHVRNHLLGWSTLSALQISRHFPWMIPVANLGLFLGWGLVVVLLGRVWGRIGGRPSLYLLSFPACLAPLLVFPGLYKIAYIAMAAALTTRVARLIWSFPVHSRRLVTTSLPVLFVACCLVVGWNGSRDRAGRAMGDRGDAAARRGATNVLLLVMDTVRADRLSLHGYGRETTPNLKRLAGSGIRFDQAQATAPWTLPSHASMFTGLWPHQTGVSENRPLDSAPPTVAEFLAGHGYLTAGFVANTYFCNSWYGLGRGFSHYEDFYDEDVAVSVSETLRSSSLGRGVVNLARLPLEAGRGRKSAAQINDDFLDWLSRQETGTAVLRVPQLLRRPFSLRAARGLRPSLRARARDPGGARPPAGLGEPAEAERARGRRDPGERRLRRLHRLPRRPDRQADRRAQASRRAREHAGRDHLGSWRRDGRARALRSWAQPVQPGVARPTRGPSARRLAGGSGRLRTG